MNLSNIIGKQIFDIFDTSFLGTLHEACFDQNYTKLLGFLFFDQDENEYYVPSANIYAIGDFVTIKNSTKVLNNFDLHSQLLPFGKQVVSIDGQDLGALYDIEIDDKYKVTNFCTQTQNINPKEIVLIANNVVVGNKKLSCFKPKQKQNTLTQLDKIDVKLLKIEEGQNDNTKLMPTKITINSDVLLGKKLSKDIVGKNNELILKQNQTLTPKLVLLAKQHEKLNELYYSVY